MSTEETYPAVYRPSAVRRVALRHKSRAVISTSSVVLFLVAWQIVGSQEMISSKLISYPTEVVLVGALMLASGELAQHSLVSIQEFVYGFVPSVVSGIVLGLIMGQFRRIRYLLDPLIMALYSMPRIALIPLLVVLFGIGMESKIAVVFLGGIFPVIVNTLAGVDQIDPLWIRAVRAFGGGRLDVVTKVILPGALPAVVAGIRLGLGRAIIGVIVGEMYVSTAGVGRLIQVYSGASRAAELFVLVIVIAVFGFLCVSALRWLEERIAPWHRGVEP